ncbi:hypothetical protein TRFO_24085 [Tritrichomonas foetus]|uniref:Uncharacterized protein n=1 Tax=Tritrichomonas foetus TaxID=1144522 RepID=A0A1J4KD78_9EUKA|nr:hypothetical protein TRFO_24085 [Tritrichomonas foetus]|eukprot:OHT07668.1 hypothetical protein TRFO_24085 [Tritrichomonas foetus]
MSNKTNFSTDPFNIYLLDNQWIVPFVRFDSPNKLNDTQTRQIRLSETIDKINLFYETRLLSSAPEKPHFPSISRSMIPTSVFLAHEHFFLQDKLYRTRVKSHKLAIKKIEDLVQALNTEKTIESAMIIVLDLESLFRYLLADSDKSCSIAEADSVVVSQISADDLILSDDVNTQINVLLHIITGMKPNYDRRALFLYDHPLQEKFDQLFYHSDFQFRDQIDDLFSNETMSSSSVFTNATVRLMQFLTSYYKLTESTEVSIFSLIYFRAVYNYAVSVNPKFFFPDTECKFHLYSDQLTIQQTGASPTFLPKHESGENLREIVAKSEKLTRAARQLTALSFHITPLDLLAAIHSALTDLRLFACEGPSNDDAQSFDTIFGLFLVVLAASDLPNQEQIFKFILEFAPPDGLSGPLEYARATVSAASLQCQSILEGILENENKK